MNEDLERQRKHFNNVSDLYCNSRMDSKHLLLKELIWTAFLDGKQKFLSNNYSMLEPMCGMAEGYDILLKHVGKPGFYLGFDYSESMVAKANNDKPNISIIWGDVTTFTSNERFDLIVVIGGLHHVYSRAEKVVNNLSGLLKDGGCFLNFEPTHDNWFYKRIRESIYKNNKLFDEDTERGFDLKEYNGLFKNANLSIVDQVYPGLLSYILFYNPDAFPLLNRGNLFLVKILFAIDKIFWRSFIGKKLSFATITLWKKGI